MSNYTYNSNSTPPPAPPPAPGMPPPPPPYGAPAAYYYPPQKKKTNVGLIIGIIAGALALVAIVLVLVLDPFGLFGGGADVVASAAPADSEVFVTVNLLKLMDDNAIGTILTFANIADSSIKNKEDLIENLDDSLDDSIGMTFTEDIQPWIGQYIGISGKGLSSLDYYSSTTSGDASVAIQIRNVAKANQFVEDLLGNLEDMQDYSFDTDDYKGVTLNVGTNWYGEEDLVIARSGKVLLIATSTDAMEDAIDAQKGESMTDDSNYRKLSGALDSSSAVFAYSDVSSLTSVMQDSSYLYGGDLNLDMVIATAASLSFVKEGVALDSAVLYDPDELTEDQAAMLKEGASTGDLAGKFPEDTLVYLGGSHLDMAWAAYRDLIVEALGSDFDSSMEMFADTVGFNLDTDLMPLMTGDYALGVYPSNEGILADMADASLGGLVIFTTSDGDQIKEYAEDVEDALYDSYMEVETESSPFDIWTVVDYYSGTPTVSYGVKDNYLIISTSQDDLEEAFERSSSLKDSENYKTALSAFGSGLTPTIYINFADGLDYIVDMMYYYDSESMEILEPIQSIVAGVSKMQNNITPSRILIVIEKDF